MGDAYLPKLLIVEVKTISNVKGSGFLVELELFGRRDTAIPKQDAVVTTALFFKDQEASFPFTNTGTVEFTLLKEGRRCAHGSFFLGSLRDNFDHVITRQCTMDWSEPGAHKYTDPKPMISFAIRVDPPAPTNLQASVWNANDMLNDLMTSQPDRLLLRAPPRKNDLACDSMWTGLAAASIAPGHMDFGDLKEQKSKVDHNMAPLSPHEFGPMKSPHQRVPPPAPQQQSGYPGQYPGYPPPQPAYPHTSGGYPQMSGPHPPYPQPGPAGSGYGGYPPAPGPYPAQGYGYPYPPPHASYGQAPPPYPPQGYYPYPRPMAQPHMMYPGPPMSPHSNSAREHLHHQTSEGGKSERKSGVVDRVKKLISRKDGPTIDSGQHIMHESAAEDHHRENNDPRIPFQSWQRRR